MKEQLLQYIWQNKLFNFLDLKTTDECAIQLLDVGKINTNGGPDFLNAKIKIDDILLIGNIELHVQASDWKLHRHTTDQKYNNVILHVVFINDWQHPSIPTLELNSRIPRLLLDKYESMRQSKQVLPCKHILSEIDTITLSKWKERLVIERLERKSNEILYTLSKNQNDWEQTCYQLLGRYFGSHINNDIFEKLTQRLDFKTILKHQNNLLQIETLLFGTAGFLNKDFVDIYPRTLKQEYAFLKHKYALQPLNELDWQFLRIRPISFPTIRLAWFAQIMQQMPFFQKIIETKDFITLFANLQPSTYWETHYTFDKFSVCKPKPFGTSFQSILLINVVAPILYAYGKYTDTEKHIERALDCLAQADCEENTKIASYEKKLWQKYSAFDSQALLELSTNYCVQHRCLECAVGHAILSKSPQTVLENIV